MLSTVKHEHLDSQLKLVSSENLLATSTSLAVSIISKKTDSYVSLTGNTKSMFSTKRTATAIAVRLLNFSLINNTGQHTICVNPSTTVKVQRKKYRINDERIENHK